MTVYPDGVVNQGVGSLIMGASRALFEQVAFNTKQVTSLDWVTYPIMRFKDAPKIDFQFVQRYDIPATNAGTRWRTARPPRRHRRRHRHVRVGLGRAAAVVDRCGDGERVLRRDRCTHPHRADVAGAGPRRAEGGRDQGIARPRQGMNGTGPGDGPGCF